MISTQPARPVAAGGPSGSSEVHRLLVSCPDRRGIVASIFGFLREAGANVVTSDQYTTDPDGGSFTMRVEFDLALPVEQREGLRRSFEDEVGSHFGMTWKLHHASERKRIVLMASRYDHCLLDLLWRGRRGEIDGTIEFVVSNHPDLALDVRTFNVPYHHIPVVAGKKEEAERRLLDRLKGQCDLVVLARYMQILSGDFLAELGVPVINIHHSFLPAFAGAGPYERAHERGVKLIGATAHYVTEELDAGPIIEQDVIRVNHRDDVGSLKRLGADIERNVLARAVQLHCQDRAIVLGNTTVVFQ